MIKKSLTVFVFLLSFVVNANAKGVFTVYSEPYTYPSTPIVNYAQNNQFLMGKWKAVKGARSLGGEKDRKVHSSVRLIDSRGSFPSLPTAVHRLNQKTYSLNDMIKLVILKRVSRSAKIKKSNNRTNVANVTTAKKTLILTLYYPLDIYTLTPRQKVLLISKLKSYKSKKLYVEGYTDCAGSREYNNVLARKRAENVAQFLNRHGFNAVVLPSFGKYHTLKTAKESRRVEIYVEK
ncbi:OmpA family protein [Hippea maritima]|uniref:OmpA/MotB domain protein n=1 Tax=Hippea maritima (strain ATCC 700847 / DSM 10411 / MH2) TaxID=760142 RepID=F2LV31_HIPMA|nr:OmpA family protein [Hippea maritima]AEA33615.1 OmpA/MotB domain protein [Hippea maritima DSM 10411]